MKITVTTKRPYAEGYKIYKGIVDTFPKNEKEFINTLDMCNWGGTIERIQQLDNGTYSFCAKVYID